MPVQKEEVSGKTEEHKDKLLGPDIFRSGGGLQHEGVGGQMLGTSVETRAKQTFWRGIRGMLLGYPGAARKVKNKDSAHA